MRAGDSVCTVSCHLGLLSYLRTSKELLQASTEESHPEDGHCVWDKGNPQAHKI